MNKDDADDLINNLISLYNGQMDSETFNQILIPNYTDISGNSYFHFLTEYSFKEFCLRNMKLNKKGKFTYENYTQIKSEYTQQIIFFINTLLENNCDIFLVNVNNQSPLILSLNNKNYIMSKEFLNILQNLGLYTKEDYFDFLDIIIKNGNCFDNDFLDLINIILNNINDLNNTEVQKNKLSEMIISLCLNFSKNIYEKYNETILITGLDYIEINENNNIGIKQDENLIDNIKKKSINIFNDYINQNFLSIFLKLIKLGGNIQYKKESGFIHLMSYPFISDLEKFVQENKVDINFQDESGNTAIINLINKKEYIIQISKDVYDAAFKYLTNNINIDIKKNTDKEKSAFYLCLKKNYIEEAKIIYAKFKNLQNSFFNPIILNFIINQKNAEEIIEFLSTFKDIIDFSLFNYEQKRSLLHYICLYISDNNNIKLFNEILSYLDTLELNYSQKDIYERNCLFYLFLNEDDIRKKHDPIQQLMYIFEKIKIENINDKDIFGNDLLFYAVKSRAFQCVDFIINHGAIITSKQNNNENSIFSISLLKKEVQLFYYLYDKINDKSIFNHKIYKSYKSEEKDNYDELDLDSNLVNCQKGETLYNFLNKYRFDEIKKNKNKKLVKNNIYTNNININNNYSNNIYPYNNNINNVNKKIISNNYYNNNLNNKNIYNNINQNNISDNNNIYQTNPFNKSEFSFSNFISDDILLFLNDHTNNISIKINKNDINDNNFDLKDNLIMTNFTKNCVDYIQNRLTTKRKILFENLVIYCIANNYEDLIRFSFNEKYNPISISNGLILYKKYNDLKSFFLRILSQNNNDQNNLQNLTDEKGQTIYHLLPFIPDNLYLCKKLENHNISHIFDNEGCTPMFYACQNFNKNFIKIFAHYSSKIKEDVNYDLFLETKNNKTPLEALYEQLNKMDNNIIKLIRDISLHTKKIIFIPLIKYLIQNYNSNDKMLYKLDYKTNLKSDEYLHKVIGLYQYYTKELKENIMIKDENGNDPLFISALNNKYDFIFDILIEEPNIHLNSTNNKGQSIIHLIMQISRNKNKYKKDILIKALKSGFDSNIKDNVGLLPLDYAILEGNDEIINILKQYCDNCEFKINENININKNIELNNILNNNEYDYNKDSDTFYNESISVSMNIDKNENLNGLVSPLFKYDPVLSYYQVCIDNESSIPFSVNLVKKDFENINDYQTNDKKYCIQIIKDLNKDDEFLTIAIDNYDVKTFTFRDLNAAKKKFNEIFKEITANDWDNVKYNKLNLKTDYKTKYIFDYTFEEENAIYEYLKITIKNLYIKQKSEYGNKKIKNLIYYLLVKSYQNKFSIDDNTLNVEENAKNIIQKYKSTAIIKAATILFDLKKLLANSNNKNDEIYLRKRNYLINSYNDLIPFSKKINNFNDFSNNVKIDEEISRLTNYYYIENVLKIFLGAIYNLNTIHPLDYIIKVLNCKIEVLPKPDNNINVLTTEADYIYNFIYSTNYLKASISAVYKITESENDKNFNLNKYDNRYLFFHGTKVENVIGILSQGLKIAPVQAINTGKSYGNGIYLSDVFSCSLGYCYHRNVMINNIINNDEKIFMFMAEVAVGNIGMNADTHIVNMTMDMNDYYVTDDGCRIFKNKKKLNYGLGIIVAHEETNVRIKYLIEIN